MPPQAPARSEQTPEEFARQLGGSVSGGSQPSELSLTISAPPDPDTLAKSLGGSISFADANNLPDAQRTPDNAIIVSDQPWDRFWRQMYAAIPDVTGMIGGAVGATGGAALGGGAGLVALPGVGAVPGAAAGAVLGAETGAGAGGIVGRGIQSGIDYLFDRPDALQNPRGVGDEATRQMTFEAGGRIFSGLLGRFRGRLAPTSKAAVERAATSQQYGLGLSPGEITDNPAVRRVEALAQRGLTGFTIQKNAQERSNQATQKAVTSILDSLGTGGSSTGVGADVQDLVTDAAARGARRVEGSVSSRLAPKTGMGATGELAEEGVQAGRTAFARQQDLFRDIVKNAPPVDVTPLQKEAWRVFNEEIMPKLIENPALGPKTPEWQKVVRIYRQASKSGEQLALSPATQKALADAALEKAPYGPLRVINQVLAVPGQMTFDGALALRGALRDAGKGQELLAGDAAEALATFFETGSRTSTFKGIRGILNETYPVYEQAATAYRTNRQLFESNLVEKVAQSNPEAVLATMTNAEGRFNASRIRQMGRVLQDLPKTYGTAGEIDAGKKAWDTLRAEWFRREVMQDNVFGLADRMKKIDPDVMAAWFPDLAGKAVKQQAEITGRAFESRLLANLAETDPTKIVDMIGMSPGHVREFERSIAGLPGPVKKAEMINRVRRAWTTEHLVDGAPEKMADRIAKADPEILKAWYPPPVPIPPNAPPAVAAKMTAENQAREVNQQALVNLRRIGNALSTRKTVSGMGAYESLGAVTLIAAATRGDLSSMLTTALGYEGLPGFVSWAMYNPKIQQYLMDTTAPRVTVTSRMAAFLRMMGEYKSLQQDKALYGDGAQ